MWRRLVCFVWLCITCQCIDDGPSTTTEAPSFGGKIKRIIALMFENRSFDHLLGYLRLNRSEIDGCLPSMGLECSNPLLSNLSGIGPYYPVGPNAVYVQPGDPDHTIDGMTLQLYGSNALSNTTSYPAPLDGFIESYSFRERGDAPYNDSGRFVMECFTPETLPIMNTLANEFAIYDRWFADVPGPTEPNRLFSWMATSKGMEADVPIRLAAGFKGNNIFELLDNNIDISSYYTSNSNFNINNINKNVSDTWRVYFENAPTPIFVEYTRRHPEKFRFIDDFFNDLKEDKLPIFSWIDPSYPNMKDYPSRDEHPCHDITEGEKFLKRIYQEFRISPAWNDTLLLIYFDENGGFFDHVSPPLAPNPDGINGKTFNFNRLGARVPVIFVSPWIKKGSIGTRAENRNGSESQYCHSSLIHTIRQEFLPNVEAINKRDEWSKTFEDIINLDEMRQDCPLELPQVPDSGYDKSKCGQEETIGFHHSLVASVSSLCNVEFDQIDQYLVNQDTAANFMIDCMKQFMNV